MKDLSYYTIKCPKCGAEYFPNEIFYGTDLIGTARKVQKDEDGKIEYAEDYVTDNEQEYVCDYCGSHLKLKAKISYSVEIDNTLNFDEDYTTVVYKDRISLKED